jgi:hypothetical protein
MKAFLQFVTEEAKHKHPWEQPVRQSKKVNEMSGDEAEADLSEEP